MKTLKNTLILLSLPLLVLHPYACKYHRSRKAFNRTIVYFDDCSPSEHFSTYKDYKKTDPDEAKKFLSTWGSYVELKIAKLKHAIAEKEILKHESADTLKRELQENETIRDIIELVVINS